MAGSVTSVNQDSGSSQNVLVASVTVTHRLATPEPESVFHVRTIQPVTNVTVVSKDITEILCWDQKSVAGLVAVLTQSLRDTLMPASAL